MRLGDTNCGGWDVLTNGASDQLPGCCINLGHPALDTPEARAVIAKEIANMHAAADKAMGAK